MNWRSVVAVWLLAPLAVLSERGPTDAPLPDPQQLKQRAQASMKESEKDLERYSCIVRAQEDELNPDRSVKRHRSREEERFYLNGVEIDHTLARDGHPLAGADARKERERVDWEVKKFSDPKQVQKVHAQDEKEAYMFLRAMRFYNGTRDSREGRRTVRYDLAGDPNFHPKKIEERFAQALTGRIWIDEDSGTPVELRVETERDVKVGGGLLATVHKGFQLHLLQQREPDGVWITKLVEGSGDMRAALFLHPRFRFKEELDKCHLFSVDTKQTLEKPPRASPDVEKP